MKVEVRLNSLPIFLKLQPQHNGQKFGTNTGQQVERVQVIVWKNRSQAVMHWWALALKLLQKHTEAAQS